MLNKIKLWFLTNEEKLFIRESRPKQKVDSGYFTLFQCTYDYSYLKSYKKIIENENEVDFIGVFPNIVYTTFYEWLLIINFFFKNIFHLLIRRKWKKIYSSLGIYLFYNTRKIGLINKLKNFINAYKFFRSLETKKQILNHSHKGIYCGDLIYDSFLRYNKKETIDIKNLTLLLYIYDCYNQIFFYSDLCSKVKISTYYSTFSTYIGHGIPVRIFLSLGIDVFTLSIMDEKKSITQNHRVYHLKKLSKDDHFHCRKHWKYRSSFKFLENQKTLQKKGYDNFKNRFEGINDLSYMKKNQYSSKHSIPFDGKFDGVVFLHDFFDSPHIFRDMVFEDFYEWTVYTIQFSIKNKLNIGFKPHPNQLDESRQVVNKLKLEYPKINWIDENISNKSIFYSGIKYGVSVYGTVLTELAYHKIIPICCGDNPSSSYNFIFEAKNIAQYNFFLKNYKSLNLPSEIDLEMQLGEYYYMNYIHLEKHKHYY